MTIRNLIDETAQGLSRKLGIPQDDVGRILSHWVHKSPPDYWPDACQDIAVSLLESEAANGSHAYAIARNVVADLWRRWQVRQHYGGRSLDETLNDETGATLADFLVGNVDYETQVCGAITCSELFNRLPVWVQEIVSLRLSGHNVNGRRSANMKTWALANAHILIA